MRPLKTLLVDDSNTDLKRLNDLLAVHPDIFDITARAYSYNEAIEFLSKEIFDLSILDNDLNGYDFRDILTDVSESRLGLIAVTSIKADELLYKAITLRNIIPFPKPHVTQTINRFMLRLQEEIKIKEAIHKSKFTIKNNKGSFTIPCDDICFIKTVTRSNGQSTEFFCDGDTQYNLKKEFDEKPSFTVLDENEEFRDQSEIVFSIKNWESLKAVEGQLNPKVFFRSADNYIINLTKITGSKISGHNRLIFFSKFQPTASKLVAVATKMGREFLERNYYVK